MGLQRADLAVVVPDVPRAKVLIQRGFDIIHNMAPRGGVKVAQSEKFLRRLMKITIRRGQKVSKTEDCAHLSEQKVDNENLQEILNNAQESAVPLSASVSTGSAHAPSLRQAPEMAQPPTRQAPSDPYAELVNTLYNEQSDSGDGVEGPLYFNNVLSSWAGADWDDPNSNNAYLTDGVAIENLLHSSFDLWSALEGPLPQVNGENYLLPLLS